MVGNEEEADLERIPAEDVAHRQRVVAPRRTAASPELISGNAVAPASTVAPKITPFTPARLARSLPLSSSRTPAASVTALATPKISTTRAFEAPE